MKIYCENIDAIPNIGKIINLTEQEQLVLEFPKVKFNPTNESQLISELNAKLPENYSIFNSSIWKNTITITIKSLISETAINQKIEFIKEGLKDYLNLSKLFANDAKSHKLKDWKLIDAHGEHNRYENIKTGQILEACIYKITSLKNIDPYFFGLFIKTSENHPELKEVIKSEFHDSARIFDYIEQNEKLKKQITQYIKSSGFSA